MNYKSPFIYIIILLFFLLLSLNLQIDKGQHFVYLAKSFKVGSLSFANFGENFSDTAIYNNQYFWPLGPFPALLILPFLFISNHFFQGIIAFPLSALNFFLLYKFARYLKVSHTKSLLLSMFFIFGSIYTPLAALPASWYFSQLVACTLLILALFEFTKYKGYLLTGIFLACAIATRFTLIFSLPFFIFFYITEKPRTPNLIKLLIPIIIAITLLGAYNYSRFKNPLEQGYNYQLIPAEPFVRRNIGLFSAKHIPANLYYMLFKGPDPVFKDKSHELKFPFLTFDSYGLSIFFLSPILFLLFKNSLKSKLTKTAFITSLVMLMPLLTYYGIGQRQVGYRYALDFYPFIFLMLTEPVSLAKTKTIAILVFWGVFFSMLFSFLYLLHIFN
jgi:hypothetical protein